MVRAESMQLSGISSDHNKHWHNEFRLMSDIWLELPVLEYLFQWPLLLTWTNFNPSIWAGASTTRALNLLKMINMNMPKTLYSSTTPVLIFQYSYWYVQYSPPALPSMDK